MRKPLLVALAATLLLPFALFAGCGDAAETGGVSSSAASTTVTTGSGATSCNGHAPDGRCNPAGALPEGCDCPDCAPLALCTSRCDDDGACAYEEILGEDCSCPDCFHIDPQCVQTDCNDDGECHLDGDACVCADCQSAPSCAACDGDGQCSPLVESCACADCASTVFCTGGSTTTTTTSGGGVGGDPGAGGAGQGGSQGSGGAPGTGGSAQGGSGGVGGS